MKKQYVNPTMDVVKVELQQVLALSGGAVQNESATVDGSGNYESLGRGGDVDDWDD